MYPRMEDILRLFDYSQNAGPKRTVVDTRFTVIATSYCSLPYYQMPNKKLFRTVSPKMLDFDKRVRKCWSHILVFGNKLLGKHFPQNSHYFKQVFHEHSL